MTTHHDHNSNTLKNARFVNVCVWVGVSVSRANLKCYLIS